jgi:26S proteasome regulatory subunit (ATPase 3-interacting protein)
MSSGRKLPAKKRLVEKMSSYEPFASSSEDDEGDDSSTSFQMEHPSSDEEEEFLTSSSPQKQRPSAFQIQPPINSQDTLGSSMSLPSQTAFLATQPPTNKTIDTKNPTSPSKPKPKKRKVSLSPQDSLARKIPPETIVLDAEEAASPVIAIQSMTEESARTSVPQSSPLRSNTATATIPAEQAANLVNKIRSETTVKPSKKKSRKAQISKATDKNISANKTKKAASRKEKSSKTPPQLKESRKPLSKQKTTAKTAATTVVSTSNNKKRKTAKAEKKPNKKPKKKSFQEDLLHHMFFTCKPFAVKTLAQELKTNEASVNYCLLSLIDKGWVVKKEFTSKSRSKELYWAHQGIKSKELIALLNIVSPDEVGASRRELAALQQQHKTLMMEWQQITKEPSNEELGQQLATAESDLAELEKTMRDTLARIRAVKQQQQPQPKQPGFGKSFLAQKKKPITCPKRYKVEINKYRDEWRKRKEKCTDFIDQLADGMEKKPKDVIKLLDLEIDEMVGVNIPPKHVIDKK